MLQGHLGTAYKITNIFKPNAPLADVNEYLEKFGNDFTKGYHITVGGPRNSLDRNYYYSFQGHRLQCRGQITQMSDLYTSSGGMTSIGYTEKCGM